MKISDLIAQLTTIKNQAGDLTVVDSYHDDEFNITTAEGFLYLCYKANEDK